MAQSIYLSKTRQIFFYQKPNGIWDHFQQIEGLPQGYPLIPVCASLIINSILQELDIKLRERAKIRKNKGEYLDDHEGGITNLMAYVDDVNAVVPYEDCLFFCNTFKKLTSDLGLQLRGDKSKILTSTNNLSPIPFISPENKNLLENCFQNYTMDKETTDGINILWFPIGSPKYITNALENLSTNVHKTFDN